MGKCNVCGKKGLFLRVNYYGRCKICDERIKKEEHLENERIRKQQEELERKLIKEKEEKKNAAKERLRQIISVYNEIDGHIFTVKADEDCEEFIPEIDKHIQKYEEFDKLLQEAKKDEDFLNVLMEFVCSSGDYFNDFECTDVKCELDNEYYINKNIYKTQKELADSMVLSWEILAFRIYRDWEKTKNSIEKAVARKKKKEAKLQKESVATLQVEDDILYSDNKVEISDIKSENFEIIPDCVVTDIETSGLIYNKNSIIEIAAIKIVGGKVVDVYSSLIHREKPLNSKVVTLTGITTEMLRNCDKDLETVITEYRDFVGDLPLVGHNIISFDIKFINEAYLKVFGKSIENLCIDTLKLSYEYFFDSASHKLGDLARFARITAGTAHRALGDCETTAYLYRFMIDIGASILLKWSAKGKPMDESEESYPKYVKRQYPTDICSKYHKQLAETGYLELSDKMTILHAYKMPELKAILIENDLPVSGNKKNLAERIIENVDLNTLNLPILYVPSEKGIVHMKKYENIFNEMAQNNRATFK